MFKNNFKMKRCEKAAKRRLPSECAPGALPSHRKPRSDDASHASELETSNARISRVDTISNFSRQNNSGRIVNVTVIGMPFRAGLACSSAIMTKLTSLWLHDLNKTRQQMRPLPPGGRTRR
jgi:hypothetical protein